MEDALHGHDPRPLDEHHGPRHGGVPEQSHDLLEVRRVDHVAEAGLAGRPGGLFGGGTVGDEQVHPGPRGEGPTWRWASTLCLPNSFMSPNTAIRGLADVPDSTSSAASTDWGLL